MNLSEISKLDENGARAYLESLRWPDGPVCAHCGDKAVWRLNGKATRPGVHKCKKCRKQFTVTVGTIFHRSHLPLRTWLMAFAMIAGAKKGVSSLQMQRALGIKCYESAWHLTHRIRHVLRGEQLKKLMMGFIEADEMFVGGKPRRFGFNQDGVTTGVKYSKKIPILTLLERGGELRASPVRTVTARTLGREIKANVNRSARLLTDEAKAYTDVGYRFYGGHGTVCHSRGQYAKPNGDHINTCESFHALMRRTLHGAHHAVSPKHLHRYVDERVWAWNHRDETDAERCVAALKLADGRRLTLDETKEGKAQRRIRP